MSKSKAIFGFLMIIALSTSAYFQMSRLNINIVGDWESLNQLEDKMNSHAKIYGINPAINLLRSITETNNDSAFKIRIREKLISWLSDQNFTMSQRSKMIELTKSSLEMALTDESREEHRKVLRFMEQTLSDK